jgi:hypothetical protein
VEDCHTCSPKKVPEKKNIKDEIAEAELQTRETERD